MNVEKDTYHDSKEVVEGSILAYSRAKAAMVIALERCVCVFFFFSDKRKQELDLQFGPLSLRNYVKIEAVNYIFFVREKPNLLFLSTVHCLMSVFHDGDFQLNKKHPSNRASSSSGLW
jgi:hypothetical protein